MSSKKNERILVCAVLALSVLLGGLLRLRGLGDASFWLDELYTIKHAGKPLSHIVASLRETGAHPPLFFYLEHLALRFGDGEWVVRLPVAAIGIATIPLLYLLGNQIIGRATGLAAALMLAVSPFHIHFSREARMYPVLALLSLLSVYALWRALMENRTPWWALFTAATVLNLYTHYFALLATGGTLLFAVVVLLSRWLRGREHRALGTPARLLVCCALIALAYLPWLPTMQVNFLQRQEAKMQVLKQSQVTLSRDLISLVVREFGGGLRNAANPVSYLALLGLVSLAARRKWVPLLLIACWTLPAIAAIALLQPRKFDSRYVAYLQPLYLLMAGAGITGIALVVSKLIRRAAIHRLAYAAVVSIALLSVAWMSVSAIDQYSKWQKTDWHEVVVYLQQNLNAGDVIIADGVTYAGWGDQGRVTNMLERYPQLEESGIVVLSEIDVAQSLESLARERSQVWALIYRGRDRLHTDPAVVHQYFDKVALARLKEPTSLAGEDIVNMLEAMTRFLPRDEGKFGIHLALAEIYQTAGRVELAQAHIEHALSVRPARFDSKRGPASGAYQRLGLDR